MWVEKRGVTKGRRGRHGDEPGSGPRDQGVTLRAPRVPCLLPGRRTQPTMPTPEIVPEHLSVYRLAREEASGSKNPRAAGSQCGRPPPGPAVLWPSWPCRARYLGLVYMVWVFCHRTGLSGRPCASRRRPLGGSCLRSREHVRAWGVDCGPGWVEAEIRLNPDPSRSELLASITPSRHN